MSEQNQQKRRSYLDMFIRLHMSGQEQTANYFSTNFIVELRRDSVECLDIASVSMSLPYLRRRHQILNIAVKHIFFKLSRLLGYDPFIYFYFLFLSLLFIFFFSQ